MFNLHLDFFRPNGQICFEKCVEVRVSKSYFNSLKDWELLQELAELWEITLMIYESQLEQVQIRGTLDECPYTLEHFSL